jgi:hypothetical protein
MRYVESLFFDLVGGSTELKSALTICKTTKLAVNRQNAFDDQASVL